MGYNIRANLKGQKFGNLVVLRFSHTKHNAYWVCQCICGKETTIRGSKIVKGQTKSCGCLVIKTNKERSGDKSSKFKHGFARRHQKTPREYNSWRTMIQRCTNPTATGYENYGGRGIEICERWLGKDGFKNFLIDMGPRPKNTSLDRIKNNGSYGPNNCKWSTRLEQTQNRRTRRKNKCQTQQQQLN
jgi:hypothetical protein